MTTPIMRGCSYQTANIDRKWSRNWDIRSNWRAFGEDVNGIWNLQTQTMASTILIFCNYKKDFATAFNDSSVLLLLLFLPDNKVHGANMGPTWVLSFPDGPHAGPINLAIWAVTVSTDLNDGLQRNDSEDEMILLWIRNSHRGNICERKLMKKNSS